MSGEAAVEGLEQEVAEHYSSGTLGKRIEDGLRQAGIDPAKATRADLKPVDEFHIGGFAATRALLDQVDIAADAQVLDIGSGIGGTARYIAETHGATVTGLDLTPDFVALARRFSRTLGDDITYVLGSALDLPFEGARFDLVTLLHVGMNIADKARLFTEIARVLRPGGGLALYDIMLRDKAIEMAFPVPWASRADLSCLDAPETYRTRAAAAGLRLVAERDRGDFALTFFEELSRRVDEEGLPPLSIALTMGDAAREKVTNMVENLRAGCYAPVEMIFEKPA